MRHRIGALPHIKDSAPNHGAESPILLPARDSGDAYNVDGSSVDNQNNMTGNDQDMLNIPFKATGFSFKLLANFKSDRASAI